jgi:hypothetical protein
VISFLHAKSPLSRDDAKDSWRLESTHRDPEAFVDIRSRNSDVDAFGVMSPELVVGCRHFTESTSFHIMTTISTDGNRREIDEFTNKKPSRRRLRLFKMVDSELLSVVERHHVVHLPMGRNWQ